MIIDFKKFLEEFTILDSELLIIMVFVEENVLQVELTLKLSNLNLVKLTFKDVIEYKFYYSNSNIFYIVSDYVLIFNNDNYYISLDPYDGNNGPSDEDSDFIKSNEINIEIL